MGTKKWTEARFAELVKEQRDKVHGWTQRELADKLNKTTPMHWTTIAKIEHGERSVRIDEAAAFADVFGVSVDYLLGRRARPKSDLMFALRRAAEAVSNTRSMASSMMTTLIERADELDGVNDDGHHHAYSAHCRKVADKLAVAMQTAEEFEFAGGEVKRGTEAALLRALAGADDA
jgi:transcriptional regulator with XRE-family HTH domain